MYKNTINQYFFFFFNQADMGIFLFELVFFI